MKLDGFIAKTYQRGFSYAITIIIYSFLIYALKRNNHFFGLNESSSLIDCCYYSSIVFTGSGYGEIYPQTQIGRIIILSLSMLKLFILIYPIEILNEYFTIGRTTDIYKDEVIDMLAELYKNNPEISN